MKNTKDDLQESLKKFLSESFDKARKKTTIEEAFERSLRSLDEELYPKKPGTYFEIKSKEDNDEELL